MACGIWSWWRAQRPEAWHGRHNGIQTRIARERQTCRPVRGSGVHGPPVSHGSRRGYESIAATRLDEEGRFVPRIQPNTVTRLDAQTCSDRGDIRAGCHTCVGPSPTPDRSGSATFAARSARALRYAFHGNRLRDIQHGLVGRMGHPDDRMVCSRFSMAKPRLYR